MLFCPVIFTQAGKAQINNPTQGFQSPEAASLGKFGDMPGSYYTGTPGINIPLYVIQSGDLEVPISLDYHASGIKVNEIASWVGLGWALNAGGVITRTVRGLPDDDSNGYRNDPYDYLYNDDYWPIVGGSTRDHSGCTPGDLPCLVQRGEIDTEPDIFFYNMNGRNGKFMRGPDGAVPIPFGHINITGSYVDWTITDEKGVRYLFGSYGSTPQTEIELVTEDNYTDDGKNEVDHPTKTYKSAWYLREIQSPGGDRTIRFNYYLTQTQSGKKIDVAEKELMETCYIQNVGNLDQGVRKTHQKTIISKPLLTRIETNSETVSFIRSENRSDQPFGTTGLTKLEEIQIHTNQGNLKKVINLNYGYFNNDDDNARRLRLESVTEFSPDSSEQGRTYRFGYIGDQPGEPMLPAYGSFDKDFWGYYNRAYNTSTALPEIPELNIPGADRSPDSTAMQAGLLDNITWPTGGTTTLTYEPHDYSGVGGRWLPKEEIHQEEVQHWRYPAYNNLVAQQYDSGSTVRYYDWVTQPFTVGNITDAPFEVEVTWPWMRNDPSIDVGALGEKVEIRESGSGSLVTTFVPSSDADSLTTARLYNISPGTYTFRMKGIDVCSGCTVNWGNLGFLVYQVTASWVEQEVDTTQLFLKKTAGGVRIRTLQTDPITGPEQIRRYSYRLSSDSSRSSGVIINEPEPYYKILIDNCWAEQRNSSSLVPLGSLSGQHVGYSEVKVATEINGEEQGRQVFYYTNAVNLQDINYHEYTANSAYFGDAFNRAQTSNEWRRGHLYKTEYYRADGALLKEESNIYEQHLSGMPLVNGQFDPGVFDIDETQIHSLVSVLRGSAFSFPATFTITSGTTTYYVTYSVQNPYYLVSGRYHPIETTVKTYDASGTAVLTTRRYTYEESATSVALGQLREIEESTSNGLKRTRRFQYAHEIRNDGTGADYAAMDNLHMLTQPYSVSVSDSSGNVLSKRWTLWSDSTGWWRPRGEWIWSGGDPKAPAFKVNN